MREGEGEEEGKEGRLERRRRRRRRRRKIREGTSQPKYQSTCSRRAAIG
jgi:hypothetical protein